MSNLEENKDEIICTQCKKSVILKDSIPCELCNDDSDDDSYSGSDDNTLEKKEVLYYCKNCTSECENCYIKGCRKCVKTVCCDCCVIWCKDCRNCADDLLCDCYGKCYICNVAINRGSSGWPCNECKKWYCSHCRYDDNDCQECNPKDESLDSEDSSVNEESNIIEEQINNNDDSSNTDYSSNNEESPDNELNDIEISSDINLSSDNEELFNKEESTDSDDSSNN